MVFTTSKSWQWPWFRLSIWWICWSMGATSCPCAEDDSPRKIGWFGTKSVCVCENGIYPCTPKIGIVLHEDMMMNKRTSWIFSQKSGTQYEYDGDITNNQILLVCKDLLNSLFMHVLFMIHHKSADSCNISCTYMNRVKSSCAGIPKWYQSLFVRPNIAVGCCFFLLGQWLQFPIWHCLTKSCLQFAGQNTSWQQEKPENWVLKPLCDEKHVLSIPR